MAPVVGKSDREAMRRLKRQIWNLVYRTLVSDARQAQMAA